MAISFQETTQGEDKALPKSIYLPQRIFEKKNTHSTASHKRTKNANGVNTDDSQTLTFQYSQLPEA